MGLLDGTAEVIGLAEEAILAGAFWVLGFQRRVQVELFIKRFLRVDGRVTKQRV